MTTEPDATPPGISIERGMQEYLARYGAACYFIVKGADDPDLALRGLARFEEDLYDDAFESVDFVYGMRWTPPLIGKAVLRREEPMLYVDAQSMLEAYPELIPELLDRLARRLREAGVKRAEIGYPGDIPMFTES